MSAKKTYLAEDHKKAYDAYYISRNISDVVRTLGLSYETGIRWKRSNFVCSFGCPWHGWDERIEEELRTLAAKTKVEEQGITDPVVQAEAMQAALEGEPFLVAPPTKEEILHALEVVNTDRERLHQWRLLRAKVFFELTGIPIDYSTLKGDRLTGREGLLKQDLFTKGLRPTKFEDTTRVLVLIDEQIDKLEARMRGEEARELLVTAKPKPPFELPDNMSPEALRRLASMNEKQPLTVETQDGDMAP